MNHPSSADFSQPQDPFWAAPPEDENATQSSFPKVTEPDIEASDRRTDQKNTLTSIVRTDMTIPLLEERLQVEYQKHKIGEIVVRKKIETRMVEIPVRYEKLIIEQVSPDHKTIAEVNPTDLDRSDRSAADEVNYAVITGEFSSPRIASQLLYELGKTLHSNVKKLRIEIELDDLDLKDTYQAWLDRFIQNSNY